MQEDNNIMQEDDDNNNFRVVYDSILKFIKVLVYGSLGALVVGAAFFWFFYEVEGEPLSAHTSEVGLKLAKQLANDGYLAGAKVIFTEKKYCIQHADMGEDCITKEEQKSLDVLIDRALFNGGPNGSARK